MRGEYKSDGYSYDRGGIAAAPEGTEGTSFRGSHDDRWLQDEYVTYKSSAGGCLDRLWGCGIASGRGLFAMLGGALFIIVLCALLGDLDEIMRYVLSGGH